MRHGVHRAPGPGIAGRFWAGFGGITSTNGPNAGPKRPGPKAGPFGTGVWPVCTSSTTETGPKPTRKTRPRGPMNTHWRNRQGGFRGIP